MLQGGLLNSGSFVYDGRFSGFTWSSAGDHRQIIEE